MLFGFLILVACGTDRTSDNVKSIGVSSTTSSSTTFPQVSITGRPSTSVAATTTTVDPTVEADTEVLFYAAVVNTNRSDFISAIEEDRLLERVDLLDVLVENGQPPVVTLVVTGSSGYRTDEGQSDKAWELATSLAVLWEEGFRNVDGEIKPSLEMVVDGKRYLADYELMVRLEERRVSREDWFLLAESG